MRTAKIVNLNGKPWQPVPADSKQNQLQHVQHTERSAEALVLELTLAHFRRLSMTDSEAENLATALRYPPAADGVVIIPISQPRRTYRIKRDRDAVHVEAGQGRISLSPSLAKTVAKAIEQIPASPSSPSPIPA